jgi:hypothetical protein
MKVEGESAAMKKEGLFINRSASCVEGERTFQDST